MSKSRILIFYGIFAIGFLLLIGRLFELQMIFGAKNKSLAEGNRIKKIVNPAPRGIIYDRNGKPLVRNVPVIKKCSATSGSNVAPPAKFLATPGKCQIITREEALELEAKGGEEAEKLQLDVGRDYLYGKTLAHVLGYLGEVTEEEIKNEKFKLGDFVGRTGIEQEYDDLLRGRDGGELIEVDALGNKVREIGKISPIAGRDIHLSIDSQLSKVAWEALQGRAGAVVASEAKTGKILVLVSSPSFNPNLFTKVSTYVHPGGVNIILEDPQKPMFNRAIGGVYPPGSTFKVVTAVAGIEEGKVDENTIFEDLGEIRIGEYVYKNWYFSQYGKTEGKIGLVRAIKRSTDTFFYKIGEWVGATTLAEWAKAFGLGRKEGIDIPGEVAGLVPDPQWKEKTTGEQWFLGNTYHFAIGQADLLATPLQINMMMSIIANEGKLCQPVIAYTSGESWLPLPLQPATPEVKKKTITHTSHTSDGGRMPSSEVKDCQDLKLKKETLSLVKEGLKEACSPGGTAFPLFNFSPQVACKTGTAEFGDPQDRTHAWLTAFAPVDPPTGGPEIVVTALVEGGGEGSYIAAPIVKKVMEAWFVLPSAL